MTVRIDYLDQRNYAVVKDNEPVGRIYWHHGTDWTVMVGERCVTTDSYKESARLAPILVEHPSPVCQFGLRNVLFTAPDELHSVCSCPPKEAQCHPETP